MAVYFLDYESGNDANDGTTFATRWKTLTNGATAARIAPGDIIRIMGSPAPTSLGINATWTNKSVTATLASALNALITNCDAAWTASANVICTADTGVYRTSTGSAKAAIAAGFTTGKVAYLGLGGALDYSAYQGITFWIQATTAALAGSTIDLRLCSDTTGDTAVDTFTLPAITQVGQWIPVYLDKGSALGASIQSISLYANADPGTLDIFLDNISTVKAAGANALNLASLIGKNTTGEYWWALRSINGTTLTIDSAPSTDVATAGRGYYGTTETVTTYKRETIKTDLVSGNTTAVQVIQDSGSSGNLLTFSGGWDRTAMTTQDLETWFDGRSGFGQGISANAMTFLSLDKLCGVRYYRAFLLDGSDMAVGTIHGGHCRQDGMHLAVASNFTATGLHTWGCYNNGFSNLNGSNWVITTMRAISCGAAAFQAGWSLNSAVSSGHWSIGTLELSNGGFAGLYGPAGSTPSLVKIGTLTLNDNANSGVVFGLAALLVGWVTSTLVASGNGAHGVNLAFVVGDWAIGGLTASNNGEYGLNISSQNQPAKVLINSLTTSGNISGGVFYALLVGTYTVLKSSMAEATKVSGGGFGYSAGRLSFHNYNGTADDHRTFLVGGADVGNGLATIFSETSVRHTASGIAWRLSPRTAVYITSLYPIVLSVAKIAVAASALVTVRLWGRRTNTGLTGFLRCRGGQIAGVAADVTNSMTASADTWQEMEITFTPSEKGVVEIEAVCYGGSTYSFYVDDLTILQA